MNSVINYIYKTKINNTMKYTLLSFIFIFLISDAVEAHNNWSDVPSDNPIISMHFGMDGDGEKIRVFPNPATDYFMLKNAPNVNKVLIYNIVGRQIKSFRVNGAGAKYMVNDLPKGMYVIRLMNTENNLIQTLRINIR